MNKSGLSGQAYNEIKKLIVNNTIKPGQFITEAEMQERLGFGRTPVREAFHELARDQLVVIHSRRGVEVSTISPKKIREIFEARKMLEPEILRMNMDKLDRDWLTDMRRKFSITINPQSPRLEEEIVELANIDNQFHREITDLCENSYIDRLLDSMFDYLTMIRITVSHNVERFNESNREHLIILDHLLNGNGEEAKRELYVHLENSLNATLLNTLSGQY